MMMLGSWRSATAPAHGLRPAAPARGFRPAAPACGPRLMARGFSAGGSGGATLG